MLLRILFISIALTIFGLLTHSGYEQYRKSDQLSVILLTVESLRADLVGAETTPNLLLAAEKGQRSLHHRAVSGWTGTNMVSLLSGLSPFQTGVHTRGQSIDPLPDHVLEILAGMGYRVSGLQGFMTMDVYKNLGLDISDVGSDPIFWLTERGKDGQPFFLWEHYVHTHLPYRPGGGYGVDIESMVTNEDALARVRRVVNETNIPAGSTRFEAEDVAVIRALHESNVREFDDWFGEFWKFFEKSGLNSRTILVLTADHGDEHGERGNVGHASTTGGGHLHEEIVKVPLFIWLPEKLQSGDLPVHFNSSNHLDVMVTLFNLLELELLEGLEGRNLFQDSSPREEFAMTSGGGFSEKDPHNIEYYEYSLLDDGWKLLWKIDGAGQERASLYDLEKDPQEIRNLVQQSPQIFEDLKRRLAKKIATAEHRPVHLPPEGEGMVGSSGPEWVFPGRSSAYRYEDFKGKFYLQWTGEEVADYVLQYKAGQGDTALEGQLEVQGVTKDFGKLSKRYWQTWIVPASPIKVRVRQIDHGGWSDWLVLEAQP